jgi:tetratricopeptide (TPR) repeat protein
MTHHIPTEQAAELAQKQAQEQAARQVEEQAAQQALIRQAYQQGKAAFERGAYRQSVEQLAQASALLQGMAAANSLLGGEVKIWLVTAYEAAGQRQEALNLCRQLTRHPHLDTRKQSRRLLYILEAPQLQRPAAWLTQIPDLSDVTDIDPKARKGSSFAPPKPVSKPKPTPEPIDLSQVETHDNQFVWVALAAITVLLGASFWLGR